MHLAAVLLAAASVTENAALPAFAHVAEAEAVRRFDLRKRLDMYGTLTEPLDPKASLLVHEGDLHVRGDLDLDGGMLQCAGHEQWRCGLVVTGNLALDGALLNSRDTAWGVFLLVLGDTRAWALHAGGSEIVLSGQVHVEDAVVAAGVKGSLAMGSLDAPVLINDGHWVKLEAGRYREVNVGGHSSTDLRCWSAVLDPAIAISLENDPDAPECHDRGETVEPRDLMLRMRRRESILKPAVRRPRL